MRITTGIGIGIFLVATAQKALISQSRDLDLPPPYRVERMVSGTITIWGHGSLGGRTEFVEDLVRAWEDGFRQRQPDVAFVNRLHGTASAIGALYTGQGDLALMGREIWQPEIDAFKEVFAYPPTGINVMTGSLDVRNRGYAIVVFVHRDNPLSGLTLTQLDAIYGVDRLRGGSPVRTWGDLGLTGGWRDKPVNLYGLSIARGFAEYFQETVFLGARKWNPSLREFADDPGSRGGASDGGQKLLAALANDRYGIGYAGLLYSHPAEVGAEGGAGVGPGVGDVKPIALARDAASPYVAPTRESVMDWSYPLTRIITMFLNRQPGQPVDPKLKEFLRYVLSREGQEAVVRDGRGYLPLLAPIARQELMKLQ